MACQGIGLGARGTADSYRQVIPGSGGQLRNHLKIMFTCTELPPENRTLTEATI